MSLQYEIESGLRQQLRRNASLFCMATDLVEQTQAFEKLERVAGDLAIVVAEACDFPDWMAARERFVAEALHSGGEGDAQSMVGANSMTETTTGSGRVREHG